MINKEVSLYVHVPFCRSKCAYCAFQSFVPKRGQIDVWISLIKEEISRVAEALPQGSVFRSVYIGGGTPSFLTEGQWEKFLPAIDALPCSSSCEITVEANPESLTGDKIRLWKDHRVNRVSVGVQSFNDKELRMCGRPHTAEQAMKALDMALSAGFRVSADLIFCLPGQTIRGWHKNLSLALSAGIKHLSVYQLMIESGSAWGKRPPEGIPDGYPMYRWAQYYLSRKGLSQYEIASFAASGEESRHNLAYWNRSDVYAAGPAAWGFVDGCRFANAYAFDEWAGFIRKGLSAVTFKESLTGAKRASEAAVLALRSSFGIDYKSFSLRYGKEWLDEIVRRLDALPARYFKRTEKGIALSSTGMRVGNAIWTELIDLDKKEASS